MKDSRLITLRGADIVPYITSMAKLELEVFSDFPYLYEADLLTQMNFIKRYADCSKSIVVLVMDGDNVVGLSTGMPFFFDSELFKKPFIDHGIDVKNVFCLGESVLLPAYRGKKIYRQFFEMREMAARVNGCSICTFVAVERSLNDPRRPVDYVPLDAVWHHFGYQKQPTLFLEFEWQDVGNLEPSKKKLVYWLKYLKSY